jgi:predicted nucleic acid-binding protein
VAKSIMTVAVRLWPTWQTFPCTDIRMTPFCRVVLDLRNNLTAYDAVYVALLKRSTLHCSRATAILPQQLAIVRG